MSLELQSTGSLIQHATDWISCPILEDVLCFHTTAFQLSSFPCPQKAVPGIFFSCHRKIYDLRPNLGLIEIMHIMPLRVQADP